MWFMQGSEKRLQDFEGFTGDEVLGQKSGWNREKWVSEKKQRVGKGRRQSAYLGQKTALKDNRLVVLNRIVINAMLMYYGRLLCSLRLWLRDF